MDKKHVLLIAAKETFLVRVLVNKTKEAGIDCVFAPWTINGINSAWEGTGIVTVFMDEGNLPDENVLHFLKDKMLDEENYIITIGEKNDLQYFTDNMPNDLIYQSFNRPVDNAKYIETVTELFRKMDSGEFKKTILVVDDDPNYLGLVREWLKGSYKVAVVNSGLQAIKWLGKNKADLILLDHEMPVTTGPQVLEMLRSDEETKNIPVMFLTGKGDKESVMAVLSLKPEGYFLKTIERKELIEKLDEYFILHKK